MPILLDTPFNPGDHDPGQTYPRAKILKMETDELNGAQTISLDFGDVTDGKWVAGKASKRKRVLVKGDDFAALCDTLTNDGETIREASKRIAYAYCQANVPELAGTVE